MSEVELYTNVTENYSFRRFEDTPANRAKQLPAGLPAEQVAIEDQLDDDGKPTGKKVFKRKTETYTLVVPTPAMLGVPQPAEDDEAAQKEYTVLQSILTGAITDLGRKLVNQGIVLTAENCNWALAIDDIYERITSSGGASGVSFSKEYLEEIAEAYGQYAAMAGKAEGGTEIIKKLIKARFGLNSTRKYVNVLPMIQTCLESFLADGIAEEDQEAVAPVIEFLIGRIAKAQETPEEVEASLFA